MPIREYACPRCGHRLQRRETGPLSLPLCGACANVNEWVEMEFAPTAMSFSLRGEGLTPKGK
jgi:uncharacterized Zn finger protein (UPF0148 family)